MIKSVLFVTHTFLPENFGGAEQQTLKIANALNKKKINTLILTVRTKKITPRKNKINGVDILRFKVSRLPTFKIKFIFSLVFWLIKILFWSFKNIKKFDAIYVVHGRLHCVPFLLVSKIFKKKLFIKIGRGGKIFDLNLIKQKKIFGNFIINSLKKNVTAWISNSDQIYKNLLSYNIPKKNIYKIYNGVEYKKQKLKNLSKSKKFLYFGRIDKEKNLNFVIKSFSKLNRKANFTFTIVGDGSEKKKLLNKIRTLNLSKKIFLKNRTNKLKKYFNSNHFFISASNSEGMSNSLLEASAHGLPSISSNVSGVKDIITDNRNGFIFNLKNNNDLKKKLKNVLKMSKKKYSNFSLNIQSEIYRKFRINIIADKHIKMFNNFK